MNILYLANHLNIGGITSYLLSLASGLKHRGHNVYIASGGGSLLPEFIERNVIHISIPMMTKQELNPKIIFSMFKLSGLIGKNDIDLVHSQSRTTQVLGCLLKRFFAVEHISTCHGFFKKRFFRKVWPCWGQEVIAISESVKEHLVKDFKVDEKKIAVIHNGIDIEKFKIKNSKSKAEIKKELGLGDGPVVGIVARLSDVKGHIYLIEAMRHVIGIIPKVQLLVVGDGKMKEELVGLTKSLGIEKNVFFRSSVTDTRDVLSVMDLFVMPSLKEGLGLSLMEAEACGLAVIGSKVGGIRTLIEDGYNGLLVEPADRGALSKAILELLNDYKKREFLGNNARVFIAQNFSEEKMVLETERVYLKCLDAKD